jgi:hypothetical protein
MKEQFKTVHENNVQINPFSIENQVKYQMENLKYKIKKLPKYEEDSYDNKSIMTPSDNGEWVKLEDALNLFSAKKDKTEE